MKKRDRSKQNEGNGEAERSTYPLARWILALAVAIAGAVFYLHGVEAQVLCHSTSGASGTDVCGPPGITELAPFALAILVLLAPDFTELAIPGLLSLKKTVSQQEQRQDQVESKLARVEQRVDNRFNFTFHLGASEDAVVVKEQTFNEARGEEEEEEEEGEEAQPPAVPPGGKGGDGEVAAPVEEAADVKEDGADNRRERDAGAKERAEYAASRGAPWWDKTGERSDVSEGDDARASLTLQLSWLAKNLAQYETISRMRQVDQGESERMAALTEKQQQSVDRWYVVFEEEIASVIRFRNALVHNSQAVDLDELREAVRIGRRLMRILLSGIGASTEALDEYPEP